MRLGIRDLVGNVTTGKVGLGYIPNCNINKAMVKKMQQLKQEEVRAGVEEH